MRWTVLVGFLAVCSCSNAGVGGDEDASTASFDAPGSGVDARPPLDGAGDGGASGLIRDRCFPGIGDPTKPLPDYDQFSPVIGSHCAGTNHQDISGVSKLVFLGDSITEGTPPNLPTQYYRALLQSSLEARFGAMDVSECAAWGARTDDLLLEPHQQAIDCLPPASPGTLVVMTIGGNDMHAAVRDASDGMSMPEILAGIDEAAALLEDAVRWMKEQGAYVVFATVYEYTDAVGDIVGSCPGAALDGLMDWPEGRVAFIRINEHVMRIAVETGSDVIFMAENFCGHGFHAGESDNECYRGPDAETWFDFTCTHPNPAGHAAIAELFRQVVEE